MRARGRVSCGSSFQEKQKGQSDAATDDELIDAEERRTGAYGKEGDK